jgi:hypothetical protein
MISSVLVSILEKDVHCIECMYHMICLKVLSVNERIKTNLRNIMY